MAHLDTNQDKAFTVHITKKKNRYPEYKNYTNPFQRDQRFNKKKWELGDREAINRCFTEMEAQVNKYMKRYSTLLVIR